MIFDAEGLADFPQQSAEVNEAVNRYVGEHQEEAIATEAIRKFIAELENKYGHLGASESPWAMWPPTVCANGRHCTFNLSFSNDNINMTIYFTGLAQKHKLILLDPQGNNPLSTSPYGGGLMD